MAEQGGDLSRRRAAGKTASFWGRPPFVPPGPLGLAWGVGIGTPVLRGAAEAPASH